MRIFSVYDSKVEAYMTPFFMKSKGEAVRSFADAANDSSTYVSKHPGDYTLFDLGEFDEETATFNLSSTPISLGVAVEFVKS